MDELEEKIIEKDLSENLTESFAETLTEKFDEEVEKQIIEEIVGEAAQKVEKELVPIENELITDATEKKEVRKAKRKKVYKIISIIIISIILFIYSVILVSKIINKQEQTRMFPYTACVAVENIEKAKINKGDLIITKTLDISEIKVGDAIIFERDGNILINTVTEIKNENESIKLVIDSNETVAKQSFTSEVKGKKVQTINGLGNVAVFIKTPIGTFIVISTLICIIAIIKSILNYINHKEQNKIWKIVKYVLISLVIIFNGYIVTKTIMAKGKAPELFKYRAFTILTKNMGDNLEVGDIAVVKSANDAQVNDIIAFRTNREVVLHRVIEKIETETTIKYKTKADTNEKPDLALIDKSDVEGIYNFRIRYVGYALIFLYKYYMYIIILILIYLLFKII